MTQSKIVKKYKLNVFLKIFNLNEKYDLFLYFLILSFHILKKISVIHIKLLNPFKIQILKLMIGNPVSSIVKCYRNQECQY